jgi:hypothetical protein
MSGIKDLFGEISNNLSARLNNPYLTYFMISFVIANYKLFVVLVGN